MELKQLKLAGFKSFVDPTVLAFPSPLVAVVGPNGCGKSNIIDAIRWVMGESSAKHLRGDSMTDVIFNGSSHRKPLGQASVELVFDNSLGRVLGPFASYGEIAIKRVLTRDGESTYYLNGTRCRRRDVVDIFLGTGAGVRGYSIISQGDVSRLIEARPEALRGYLEEAAGISKYKERRRETMTRIQHTRENLLRIADIRDELGKQLQRLEKQGKTAEQYLQLKAEERLCRAEILALKWRDLTQEQFHKQKILQKLAQSHANEQLEAIRQQKDKDCLQLNLQNLEIQAEAIQKAFYLSAAEITRLQESINQFQREKTSLIAEKQQLHADYENAHKQITNYQSLLEIGKSQVKLIGNNVIQLNAKIQIQEELLLIAACQQQTLDEQYETLLLNTNNVKNEAQIAEINWNNNEQQYQQILVRLEKLAMEAAAMDIDALEQEGITLANEREISFAEKDSADKQLIYAQRQLADLRTNIALIEKQLRQLQDTFHQTKTQHAALSAAQGAAATPLKKYPIKDWLNKPRLLDIIQVEPEWQLAFEYVVGDQLKALVLEDNEVSVSNLHLLANIGENIVTLTDKKASKLKVTRLSDKIIAKNPCLAINLDAIYIADTLEAAIAYRACLEAHESVITVEGFWFGPGWISIPKPHLQDSIGLLARQQKISELLKQLENYQEQLNTLGEQRDNAYIQLQQDEKEVISLQKNLQECLDVLNAHETKQAINVKRLQLAKTRQQVLAEEDQELKEILENLLLKKYDLSRGKEKLAVQWKLLAQEQQQLLESKKEANRRLIDLKQQFDNLKTEMHQNALEQDRAVNQIKQMDEGIAREQERIATFNARLAVTMQRDMENDQLFEDSQQKLITAIKEHQALEQQLQGFREQLAQEKHILVNLETLAKQQQVSLKALEASIAQERLAEQALALRIQNFEESLQEQALSPSDLLVNLADSLTSNLRESALSVIMDNISRLGAINLAAIEEYAEERTRKENMDAQYADLQEALLMLESAIEQMDKETQLRLANTFEQVNDLFKSLFPRLFGGGKAYLELTSSNLLEAGVVVMAQPPGKRNSSIQLLSGGEKAMTALALVFAIFQLNPSPFCMLDEVDAPLDDANVIRFCNVVKEMSRFVQFLFITHNKVTMELAEQLIGVTMREPGVSRLVTVDIIDLKETILE